MGCSASKAAEPKAHEAPQIKPVKQVKPQIEPKARVSKQESRRDVAEDKVFQQLITATKDDIPSRVLDGLSTVTAAYQHPKTGQTPLHLAVQLIEAANPSQENMEALLDTLIEANPEAVLEEDSSGLIPLHYAIAPGVISSSAKASECKVRSVVVSMLLEADQTDASSTYLHRNDVIFHPKNATGGCSPLYRALQTLPDDFETSGWTVEYVKLLVKATSGAPHSMVGVGNSSDGDKPLALLYRRFTRQFDLAEKFFSGDNSRPEVVEHRLKYKTAAGNTWRIIEALLKPQNDDDTKFRTVHRAVQVETPPDLLRYIVETNAEDLTVADEEGNLPLHYAAMSKPPSNRDYKMSFPAFYTKYVVDELLYKYPEAAAKPDAAGNFPLTLAVKSGKQWIGGGIKSLYDAYPEAMKQINVEEHQTLKHILSTDSIDDDGLSKEEKENDGIVRDEHHDAIMLVQQQKVDVSEVVTSMWAHEEDAGVQMLGCVALARMVESCSSNEDILRIALSAVPAVVNAMKAHPNEVIVQEKACRALRFMAAADGKREVSFVASGAVAAVVGAMQAHVSDPGVQEEACGAIAMVIHFGGADLATIVASVSGLTALVNSIAAHPSAVGVQKNGCNALLELTEFSDVANLPEVSRTQTEPLLETAKQNFPDECGDAVERLLSRLV